MKKEDLKPIIDRLTEMVLDAWDDKQIHEKHGNHSATLEAWYRKNDLMEIMDMLEALE